jgi:uncharacterized protein (TIGR02266 family)
MGRMGKRSRQKQKKAKAKATPRFATIVPPPLPLEDLAPESHVRERPSDSTLDALAAQYEPDFLGGENRASPRVALDVELQLASDAHFFAGLSGDISEGGIFVSTYRPLAIGSEVDLTFSLPGSTRQLRARGRVRWHRDASPNSPPGAGIAFDDLAPDARDAIQRFCTSRPPLYYDDVG